MSLHNRERQDRFKEAVQNLIELRLELSHFHMRLLSVIPAFPESELGILWSGFAAEMTRIDQEIDLQDKHPIDSIIRPYIDSGSQLRYAIDTLAAHEVTGDGSNSLDVEKRFALIGAMAEATAIARSLAVVRRTFLSLNPSTYDMAYVRGYAQPKIARETGLDPSNAQR
jgi:hypothetical protein